MIIRIDGKPIAKARARHSRKGGKIMTYDPQSNEKNYVKLLMKKQKTYRFRDGAFLCVELTLGIPIQKNTPKTEKNAKLWGFEKPSQKPDLDNYAKFYLDCANGILWHDDNQVVKLILEKKYSEKPYTELKVMPYDKRYSPETERVLTAFTPDELKEFLDDMHLLSFFNSNVILGDGDKEKFYDSLTAQIMKIAEKHSETLTKIKRKKTSGQGKSLC